MQTAPGITKAALLEVASVRGQLEEKIQSYVSCTEVGVSCAVEEATPQLTKEVQAAAPSVITMSIQQTQELVGTIRGELQAQMEAGHQEMKK